MLPIQQSFSHSHSQLAATRVIGPYWYVLNLPPPTVLEQLGSANDWLAREELLQYPLS